MTRTDAHLVRKIQTATTVAELDTIRDDYRKRGDQMPSEGVAAFALRKAEIQKAELKRKGK